MYTVEPIEFIRELVNIELNELGVEAVFECEVSKEGLMPEWFKGKKQLKRGEQYNIVTEGCVHRLIIEKAVGEDEGEYTVVFKDKNLTSKATLTISGMYIIKLL